MFWKRNINDINMFKSCLICNLMLNFYFSINNLTKRQRNASIQSIFQTYIFQLCLLYMRYNTHVHIYIRPSLSLSLYIYIYIYIIIYVIIYIIIYIYIYIYAYMYLCLGTSEEIRYQFHLNMIAQEELGWKHLWNAANFC